MGKLTSKPIIAFIFDVIDAPSCFNFDSTSWKNLIDFRSPFEFVDELDDELVVVVLVLEAAGVVVDVVCVGAGLTALGKPNL